MMPLFCWIISVSFFCVGGFPLSENPGSFGQPGAGFFIKNLGDSLKEELGELVSKKSNPEFLSVYKEGPLSVIGRDLIRWTIGFLVNEKRKVHAGLSLLIFPTIRQPDIKLEIWLEAVFREDFANQIFQQVNVLYLQSEDLAGGIEGARDAIQRANSEVSFLPDHFEWWMISLWVLLMIFVGLTFLFAFRLSPRGYLYGPNGRQRVNSWFPCAFQEQGERKPKSRGFPFGFGSSAVSGGSFDGGGASGRW